MMIEKCAQIECIKGLYIDPNETERHLSTSRPKKYDKADSRACPPRLHYPCPLLRKHMFCTYKLVNLQHVIVACKDLQIIFAGLYCYFILYKYKY